MEDPDGLLTSQQLFVTTYIAEHSLLERLRRRARLLIAYHQGQTTASAAVQAGLSRGRVRYWRRQFMMRGMDIFPENEKSRVIPESVEDIAGTTPVENLDSNMGRISEDELRMVFSGLEAASISAATEEYSTQVEVKPIILPARMTAPGVLAMDPIAEAGRKVMLFNFAEMLSHEEGTRLGENSEELHDMRVASRRMRAAFDIFIQAFDEKAIKPHLKGLRATGRALGRVRDMDVFIEKAITYQHSLPVELQPGLEPLLETWEKERNLDRAQMLDHLDSPRYQQFKLSFSTFLQTSGAGVLIDPNLPQGQLLVRDFAPVLIYNRLASVRAFETVLSNANLDQLHALRIEFKKLRYAVEFFREILGEQARDVINALKVVQDHLGELNDARVATQMISEFMEAWEARQAQLPLAERKSPEPIVAFLAAKHAERYHLMVTFPETWAKFNQPEFRQNLAMAIAAL